VVLQLIKDYNRDGGGASGHLHFLNHTNVLHRDNTCCGHPDATADNTLAQLTVAALSELFPRGAG
jgi:hypothetical protein